MDTKILRRFKRRHFGQCRAASSHQLETQLGISGRQLRQAVSDLRCAGHPICSGDDGYFYAETREELEATIRQLNSRISKIAGARNGLLRALRRFSADDDQFILAIFGGDVPE